CGSHYHFVALPRRLLASDGGAPAPRRPPARTTTSSARLGRWGPSPTTSSGSHYHFTGLPRRCAQPRPRPPPPRRPPPGRPPPPGAPAPGAPPPAGTTASPAAGARGLRVGHLDRDATPVELATVQLRDRVLRLLRRSHLDEPEAARLAREPVRDDGG